MSVMQQMIERAMRQEAEEQAAQDAARAEVARVDAAEIAERRERLIEWLGPLTDEMEVSAGRRDGSVREILYFQMRPSSWTCRDVYIGIKADGRTRHYQLYLAAYGEPVNETGCNILDAAGDGMALFLLNAQREYDARLAEAAEPEAAPF